MEDAKNGIIPRREFNKLHILMAPHMMIVTCEVSAGRAHKDVCHAKSADRLQVFLR